MRIHSNTAQLQLPAHQTLRLTQTAGTILRGLRGTAWVTIDRDPRDLFLLPGDLLVIESGQPVVVSALNDSVAIEVQEPPAPSTPPQGAFRSWLARSLRPRLSLSVGGATA